MNSPMLLPLRQVLAARYYLHQPGKPFMRVKVIAPLYEPISLLLASITLKRLSLFSIGLYVGHMWRNINHFAHNARAANNTHAYAMPSLLPRLMVM
jgi:hypothetical protein